MFVSINCDSMDICAAEIAQHKSRTIQNVNLKGTYYAAFYKI